MAIREAVSSDPEPLQPREKFQITPVVYMILRKGENIFFLKRKKSGNYSLPAGHVEEGERSLDAALRETEEETGVKVNPLDARFVHTGYFKDHDGQRVAFFYEASSFDGEPKVMEDDVHEEACWLPINKLPDNFVSYTRLALQNIAENKAYTEYGWD